MKVISTLFLSLLLFGLFAPTSTFAEAKSFLITTTNVYQVCTYSVQTTETGTVKVQKLSCVLTPAGQDAILTSLRLYQQGTQRWLQYHITTDGAQRDLIAREFDEIAREYYEIIEITAPLFENLDNYALQTSTQGSSNLDAQSNSAAISDRLFSAGTKNTASANDYFSFVLNSDGIPTGAKSVIFSNPTNKFALGGTMSRDGGIAVQLAASSTVWKLSTRLLNAGVPRKTPVSWTVPAYNGYSPDITNPIEANAGVAGASTAKFRYLVYRAFKGVGTSGQQSQIMILKIDDATGQPLEAAKALTPFKNAFLAAAEAFQALAIAPNGELLIFTEYSGACKKMILKAAKLVNGSISGPAKVIAGCTGLAQSPFGYVGLDIAEDLD